MGVEAGDVEAGKAQGGSPGTVEMLIIHRSVALKTYALSKICTTQNMRYRDKGVQNDGPTSTTT